MKWIVGIDEVGRGPLAGPVCIGLCFTKADKQNPLWKVVKNIKDSKKLSERQRKEWLEKIESLSKDGLIFYSTSFVGNKIIDKCGISKAIKIAIRRTIKKAKLNKNECGILLDGSLFAPKEFLNQKTIIKGDEKEPIIALASIVAKVKRDEWMKKIAKKYPNYGFEIHKGYGTKEHIKTIKKYGLSTIHRRSFVRKIMA